MKKAIRTSLFGLWILLASAALTRWWMVSPSSAFIPDFPQAFWVWLIKLLNAHDNKTMVVIWVGLCLSSIIVTLLTLCTCYVWRRFQARKLALKHH